MVFVHKANRPSSLACVIEAKAVRSTAKRTFYMSIIIAPHAVTRVFELIRTVPESRTACGCSPPHLLVFVKLIGAQLLERGFVFEG